MFCVIGFIVFFVDFVSDSLFDAIIDHLETSLMMTDDFIWWSRKKGFHGRAPKDADVNVVQLSWSETRTIDSFQNGR